MPMLMSDISHYQSPAAKDFVAYKKRTPVVWFKATEGTSFIDPEYAQNVADAEAASVVHGAYHFVRQGQGGAQARHFLSVAKRARFLVIDWEDGDRATALDILHTLKAATARPVIGYTGAWARAHGGVLPGIVGAIVPNYGPASLPSEYKPAGVPLVAWQYTNGKLNGTSWPSNLGLGGDQSVVYLPRLLGLKRTAVLTYRVKGVVYTSYRAAARAARKLLVRSGDAARIVLRKSRIWK
jgi:hypothetical protein